jgi:hypothetical protein
VIGAWHWTWQDPIAIALVALALLFALTIGRRLARRRGCGSCPLRQRAAASGLRTDRARVGSDP